MAGALAEFIELARQRWPDKRARLADGFYTIKDKSGAEIPFRMNADQFGFFDTRHGMDLILKARQKGFTTIIQLDMLDDCLFLPNTAAGVIAHNLDDAEAFFKDKIKFAYDSLPPEFRLVIGSKEDSARTLRFDNGSSIRVGTSLRSGTLQRLHVSEYGKLCAKFPAKAEEVKAGAFNTVAVGQRITVESTAEGQEGHFYDMCQQARRLQQQGSYLSPLDFKLHFSPWWTSPEYSLAEPVPVSPGMRDYFLKLDSIGIDLTPGQRWWYVKKAEQQGAAVKREYPATPEEAFEASIEGAYLSTEMARVRKEGRICRIPVISAPVDTFWDLGVNDDMCIWFRQEHAGQHRFIGYYAFSGEGMEFYARKLQEFAHQRQIVYGTHWLPHDGKARRLGLRVETAQEMAESVGIRPVRIVPVVAADNIGVEASRKYLRHCWFDEEECAEGIWCLDNFRKEWDDARGIYRDRYRHDKASHGYKAFETAARAPGEYEIDDDEGYVDAVPDAVTGY